MNQKSYIDLKSQGSWTPSNDKTPQEAGLAEIKGLKAMMNKLVQKGTTGNSSNDSQNQGNAWKKKVKCYNCGKRGHFKSECPELTQNNSNNGENRSQAT